MVVAPSGFGVEVAKKAKKKESMRVTNNEGSPNRHGLKHATAEARAMAFVYGVAVDFRHNVEVNCFVIQRVVPQP